MTMANRVQIIVEASDATGGVLRGILGQFGDLGRLTEDLTSKNRDWGNIAQSATTMVINGIRGAIDETQKYASEVRGLSLISGQSTESTSRFIQVLDDYGLSAEDAETATRALTKQGLAPTIDTLASLSDQYLKINDTEEKNAFIMKNLGRAGLEWVGVLNQGSAAIKSQGAEVDKSLILTQKQVDASREYFLALDGIKDKWTGIQIELGSELIPTLTATTNVINDNWEALKKLADAMEWVILPGSKIGAILAQNFPLHLNETDATKGNTAALQNNSQAASENSLAIGDVADAQDGLAKISKQTADEIARIASSEREATLGAMFAIEEANKAYANEEDQRVKKEQDIKDKEIQNAQEMSKTLVELQDAKEKHAKTDSEKEAKQNKIQDLQDKYNSLIRDNLKQEEDLKDSQKSGADALKEKEDATNKLVYAQLQQKAAQDGIVSPEEEKFLMDTAVNMGLISRAEADAAIMATQMADSMWTEFTGKAAPAVQTVVDLMDAASSHNGEVINVTVAYNVAGNPPGKESGLNTTQTGPTYTPISQPKKTTEKVMHSNARGGSWVIPSAFGNEGYVLPDGNTASGGEGITITPAGANIKNGNTVNIYATVRNNNDLDYLAQEVTRRIAA